MTGVQTCALPIWEHVKPVHEQHRNHDARDVIDDEVEGVAIDARNMIAHIPGASSWAIDSIEHHCYDEPEDGGLTVTVADSHQTKHAAQRTETRETVNEPALCHGVAERRYAVVGVVGVGLGGHRDRRPEGRLSMLARWAVGSG